LLDTGLSASRASRSPTDHGAANRTGKAGLSPAVQVLNDRSDPMAFRRVDRTGRRVSGFGIVQFARPPVPANCLPILPVAQAVLRWTPRCRSGQKSSSDSRPLLVGRPSRASAESTAQWDGQPPCRPTQRSGAVGEVVDYLKRPSPYGHRLISLEEHAPQAGAARERPAPDVGDAVADRDARQAGAARERIRLEAGDAVGDRDAGQTGAAENAWCSMLVTLSGS